MAGMDVGLAGLRAARHLSGLPAHSMGVYVFPCRSDCQRYTRCFDQLAAGSRALLPYWETDTRQSFIEVLPSRELTTGM